MKTFTSLHLDRGEEVRATLTEPGVLMVTFGVASEVHLFIRHDRTPGTFKGFCEALDVEPYPTAPVEAP